MEDRHATAGPTRALAVLLVVPLVLLGVGVAPRAAATPGGSGGEGPAPAGVWPLSPGPDDVVRGFDPPSCTWCAGNRGVDLAGTVAASVRAVFAGDVTYAGPLAGRDVVVVDDGTERTTYEPVAPVVHRGDSVTAGQVIGRLAVVGGHCLPAACLHLGLIRDSDDAYLDPLALFGDAPRPVRLLPLWGSAWGPVAPVAAVAARVRRWLPLLATVACQVRVWACWQAVRPGHSRVASRSSWRPCPGTRSVCAPNRSSRR